jgi:hypothetical protein
MSEKNDITLYVELNERKHVGEIKKCRSEMLCADKFKVCVKMSEHKCNHFETSHSNK